jgi:hypothetical protein
MDGAKRSQNRELMDKNRIAHRAGAETASHRLPVGRAKPGTQPRTRRRHLLALGGSPDRVSHGDTESQRLLADESEFDCAIRAQQPLAGGTRGSRHESRLDRSALRA